MKPIPTLLAAALIGASLGAFAHEGQDHGNQARPAKKEQQPWGVAGEASAATRTIEITMSDAMRFSPDLVEVRQGDTVRFVVKNPGQVLHELVIGTKEALDEHAALMAKFPAMEHDEPFMAHVKPGQAGELVWTFNRPGTFDFACLVPGHYQAGMVGKIKVLTASKKGESHDHQH